MKKIFQRNKQLENDFKQFDLKVSNRMEEMKKSHKILNDNHNKQLERTNKIFKDYSK